MRLTEVVGCGKLHCSRRGFCSSAVSCPYQTMAVANCEEFPKLAACVQHSSGVVALYDNGVDASGPRLLYKNLGWQLECNHAQSASLYHKQPNASLEGTA